MKQKKIACFKNIIKYLFYFIIFTLCLFIIHYKYEKKEEIDNLKKYYQLCKNDLLINKKKTFEKVDKPKISIISPVYNRENHLIKFLRSIQNQNFKDIEIILIDDFSIDNSREKIEKLKNEDDRILFLKNKYNKGTFISRNIAALKAKGEFLIFPDPDDIMSPNILRKCYYVAKKNNYEFIRFHMYSDKKYVFSSIPDKLENIIYQPDLRVHMIYGLGYSNIIDGILNNKFVSKSLFIKSLNSIKEYYLNKKMIYFEDGLINFSFYFNAKSLYLLRNIGYYYFLNNDSISMNKNMNYYFENFFVFLKYIYENTKNNILEKNMTFYLLQNYVTKNEVLYKVTNYSKIYTEVINEISKCDFISKFFALKCKKLKDIISKIKKMNKNPNHFNLI